MLQKMYTNHEYSLYHYVRIL